MDDTLETRAFDAFNRGGEDAYWQTLASPPREGVPQLREARMHRDPEYTGNDGPVEGTGHASDGVIPLDKLFR